MCKKKNQSDYGIDNDYNQDNTFILAQLKEIEDKKEINSNYPYKTDSKTNLLIIKYGL